MESMGAMSELNWASLNGVGPVDEPDFMSQLLPFMNDQDCDPSFSVPPAFWPGDDNATDMVGCDDDSYYHCSDAANSSLYCWPQWGSTSLIIPTSNNDIYAIDDANVLSSMPVDLCKIDEKNMSASLHDAPSNLFEDIICLNEDVSGEDLGESGGDPSEAVFLPNLMVSCKRKMEVPESEKTNSTNPSENPKKKSRASGNVQRNGKNMQSKKNSRSVKTADDEETSAAAPNGQSSSSCLSEDDSNASQELNGGGSSSSSKGSTLNLSGRTRAGRGAATDPQSLYARKRRERINERLRILQNLVPNGTKVDISTMLEEAVQYVKFLQLQIKLLSSDDLWMYAPIAYNGMDIGLDLNNSTPR